MKTTLTVLLIINLYGLAFCAMKQHFYINVKKNWTDALQYCTTRYYNLSTFTDEIEEQQFLQDVGNVIYHSWVGLYKESGIWKWAGGEVATRISWDVNQPDNDDYVILLKETKKLHDVGCTPVFHLICMNVSEFVMIQQSESWEGALEYCRDHYDDLASLSSNRSMTDALSKISAAQTQYVWIGLHFLAGEWFWISRDNVQYQAWSPTGQPQCPAQNQRCAALDKQTNTWTNRDCEENLNFLCVFRGQ